MHLTPFSAKMNQGSSEKWLVLGLGHKIHQANLENVIVSENKGVLTGGGTLPWLWSQLEGLPGAKLARFEHTQKIKKLWIIKIYIK